jgi:hypothetical protein
MGREWRWGAAIVLAGATFGSGWDTADARDAPQGGQTCIAIVLPSVQGIEGSATSVGATVRDLFASYLTGPSVQVVPLEARLASQAMEEARQRHCPHVLTLTVTHKRGGGGFSRIAGQAAGSAAWHIPGGGSVGSAVVRGAAIGTTEAIAALATSTKAKDEIQLEYRVSSPAGATEVGPTREKRKAKFDGEDLLTPLVEKAAQAIVGTLVKK